MFLQQLLLTLVGVLLEGGLVIDTLLADDGLDEFLGLVAQREYVGVLVLGVAGRRRGVGGVVVGVGVVEVDVDEVVVEDVVLGVVLVEVEVVLGGGGGVESVGLGEGGVVGVGGVAYVHVLLVVLVAGLFGVGGGGGVVVLGLDAADGVGQLFRQTVLVALEGVHLVVLGEGVESLGLAGWLREQHRVLLLTLLQFLL